MLHTTHCSNSTHPFQIPHFKAPKPNISITVHINPESLQHLMPKSMKFPFLFKNIAPWPLCNQQPRTLSFRADRGAILKTAPSETTQTPESMFSCSSDSASLSTASGDDESGGGDLTETLIRGLRSERLFFEPGETNSILSEAKDAGEAAPFKESMVMSLESRDPYADFRESMEEMVEAHGLKEWDNLEELLGWYLTVNGKQNHDYIVGAFVDLLVGLAAIDAPPINNASSTNLHRDSPSSLSLCTSFSSSSSTPCVSSSLEAPIQEIYTC